MSQHCALQLLDMPCVNRQPEMLCWVCCCLQAVECGEQQTDGIATMVQTNTLVSDMV